jgi:hypothetical protein
MAKAARAKIEPKAVLVLSILVERVVETSERGAMRSEAIRYLPA